jgi:3-dehydroquinate synthase
MALAHAVSRMGPRFLLVQENGLRSASLFLRTNAGLVEQRMHDATVAGLVVTARTLGVSHCAVHSCCESSTLRSELSHALAPGASVETLSAHAIVSGAIAFSDSVAEEDGLWHGPALSSRVNATQRISYTIHRPVRAVFDADELTLSKVVGDRPVLLAVDAHIDALHGEAIRNYARRRLNLRGIVHVSPAEGEKSWSQVESLCQAAVDAGIDRRGIVVAIGGGVTLDIAGLAAAVFRRGVGYVRVPTTLVGLIDVSLGVKQAVNACGRKSLVGAFHAPIACINDYQFLQTLPRSEIACGLAEAIKMALVRDAVLYDEIDREALQLMQPAVCASLSARDIWFRAETLMLEELSSNLYEANLARLVDFGHTFSPVIEASSDYRIAHGRAVALDMLLSTGIGVCRGICDPALFHGLARLLDRCQLPVHDAGLPRIETLHAALDDARRHRGGNLNLVIPVRAGRAVFVQAVSAEEIAWSLAAMRSAAEEWRMSAAHADVA